MLADRASSSHIDPRGRNRATIPAPTTTTMPARTHQGAGAIVAGLSVPVPVPVPADSASGSISSESPERDEGSGGHPWSAACVRAPNTSSMASAPRRRSRPHVGGRWARARATKAVVFDVGQVPLDQLDPGRDVVGSGVLGRAAAGLGQGTGGRGDHRGPRNCMASVTVMPSPS